MSVDFTNDSGEEFCFSNSGWRQLTAYAEETGWKKPLADSNCYSSGEAIAFAEFLEKRFARENLELISSQLTRILVEPSDSAIFPNDPIVFNQKNMDHWQNFVSFLRRGAFDLTL